MKKYIDYHCKFKIYSEELSGQEMVDIIGLQPTRYWSKGELMHHGKNVYPSNGYIINFYEKRIDKEKERSEIDTDLSNEINLFLDKLLQYKAGILEVTKTTKQAYITIGVSKMSHHIGIQITPEIMKKLIDLNLRLDCDIYGDD